MNQDNTFLAILIFVLFFFGTIIGTAIYHNQQIEESLLKMSDCQKIQYKIDTTEYYLEKMSYIEEMKLEILRGKCK